MGGVKSTPRRKNSNTRVFIFQWFQHLLIGTKTVLMYFLNTVRLHDVIYVQNKGFKHPLGYLFCISFIIKTKVLKKWDESYHNTSIEHINKKKDNSTLQLTY